MPDVQGSASQTARDRAADSSAADGAAGAAAVQIPADGRPLEILRDIFGYADFRGPQRAIIDAAIAGGDSLVLMPTGGGKSLCFQIPSLIRAGTGLVVSPLIALMADQVGALRELGLEAAGLNSTLTAAERANVERRLRAGELDFLYVAPERLMQPQTLALFRSLCAPSTAPGCAWTSPATS
jgi:ATP-dependent DNA helicase RecQ